jgi:hypothetical protein
MVNSAAVRGYESPSNAGQRNALRTKNWASLGCEGPVSPPSLLIDQPFM